MAFERIDRAQLDAVAQRLQRFRYTPNSRGFIFLQICAAGLWIVAYVIYLATEFSAGHWSLLSGACVIGGAFLIWMVVRWHTFAKSSYVAFDNRHLYVVRRSKIARVAWTNLDAQAAGFDEDPEATGQLGVLQMHVGNSGTELILFNAFVVMDDFPTFLVELLTQIKTNHESADMAAVDLASSESEAADDNGESDDDEDDA